MIKDLIKKLQYNAYRFKYNYAPQLNLTKPVDISLELASVCNQSCVYCYWSDPKNIPFKTGFMPFKTAQLIIAQAADLKVPSIKFNYRGEASTNPEFYRITSFAKQMHYETGAFIDRIINSNFKFNPNRKDIFEGLANQTKIKVSIDSFNKTIMEKQRKGAIFEQTVSNIDTFYKSYKDPDSQLVIQVVRTNENKDEDFETEIKKRWPAASLSIRDMVLGRVNKDLSDLEHKERSKERQSCIQAHSRLIFDINGSAQVCCPDISSKLQVGNINEKDLKQIWQSKQALEIRKSLKNKSAFKFDPCKTCSSYESYKGFKPNWNS